MSPKRLLRALIRPREAFDGWLPGLGVAVTVVLLLCVLNGASVAFAGDAVTSEVSGTVTVENPDHPPEWVCEGPNDQSGWNCNASETIEKPLRPAANTAVGGASMAAAFAPLAWVLLFAGLFVVVSGSVGGRDGEAVGAFRDGLGVASIAAVPGVLRYLARPIAVERTLSDWTHPHSLDAVGPAAVDVLFPDGTGWLLVVVISGVWSAAVVYGGARSGFDAGRELAVPIAVGALFTTALSVALAGDGRVAVPFGLGILCVGGGIVGLLGARTYISFSKSFELIGFGGSEQVTPKPWYVALHRIGALVALILGYVFVDGLAFV